MIGARFDRAIATAKGGIELATVIRSYSLDFGCRPTVVTCQTDE
jgi:hypothetical protein